MRIEGGGRWGIRMKILGWQWRYVDALFAFTHTFELHDAVNFGEEGIIFSHADIESGMDAGTQLPYNYIACLDLLPAVSFYPSSLALTVPAIAAASLSFFVSHGLPLTGFGGNREDSLHFNFLNTQRSETLPVSLFLTVFLSTFEFKNGDFLCPVLLFDLPDHLHTL